MRIVTSFGQPLVWECLEGSRACLIQYTCAEGGHRSPEEQWPQIQDEIIHDMDTFEKALQPYVSLSRLKTEPPLEEPVTAKLLMILG